MQSHALSNVHNTACYHSLPRPFSSRIVAIASASHSRRSNTCNKGHSNSSLATRMIRSRCARLVAQASATDEEVEIDWEEDAMTRMEKSLESTRQSFATVRTGRATSSMLDRIQVDYYGAPTPLRQIANLSAPDAGLLVVQPYDKSSIPNIEKAILNSDLALTPNNDGNVIRLNIPQLTADRRKEMAKLVSKLGEDGKVAIRNVRRDVLKAVDKVKGDLSEDEVKRLGDAIQDLTDDYVAQVDKLVRGKQDELTTV